MKLKSNKQKYQYITSTLAFGLASSSLLISSSAQAVDFTWTKGNSNNIPTFTFNFRPLSSQPTNSFFTNNTLIPQFTPFPFTPLPITPSNPLTNINSTTNSNSVVGINTTNNSIPSSDATNNTNTNTNISNSITVPAEVGNSSTPTNSTLIQAQIPIEPISNNEPLPSANSINSSPSYAYNGSNTNSNSPADVAITNSSAYTFTPNPDSLSSPINITTTVNVNNSIAPIGLQAPATLANGASVVPFNFSMIPGLLGVGGVFGLKYAMGKIKTNLES